MNWFKSEEQEEAPEVEESPYIYKVTVVMKDNSIREFLAGHSYDAQANGRIVYWQEVLLDGKEYEYYAIPVNEIRELAEQEN